MAGVPPKKNTTYTFYIGLEDKANPGLFKPNPTLAAGDFKVAIDDGAPANLATLPVVDADFTKRVKVVLSSDEMNGDHISVICSDAAGAEWCDILIEIDTDSKQIGNMPEAAPSAAANASAVRTELATELGRVDTTVSSRSTYAGADTSGTTTLLSRLGTPQGASISADIADIPNVLEFEARSLPSEDYFNPTDDTVVTVANVVNDVAVGSVSSSTANAIADATLKRDWSLITGEASRSLLNAMRFLRNKWTIVGSTLTVMKEDDTTPAWTATLTSDGAADPVTGSDPS